MRKPETIAADLEAARAAYHEAANEEPAPELRRQSEKIKALMAELSDCIAHGAEDCPQCGNSPHGMIRSPEYRSRGRLVPAVYAVGCLVCPGLYADGASPEAAARAWNAGEYVERPAQIKPASTGSTMRVG
jgi:hypothetical protein